MAITIQNTLGDIYTHALAGTTDVNVLTRAPLLGESLTAIFVGNATQTIVSVTSPGVRWRRDKRVNASFLCEVWKGVCIANGAGTSVTVTHGIAGIAARCLLLEESGLGNWPAFYDFSTAANPGSVTVSTGPLTLPTGFDYLCLAMARTFGTAPAAPGGGFTALATNSTGYQFAYKLVTSVGAAETCTWSQGSGAWEALLIAYRLPAAIPLAEVSDLDTLLAVLDPADQTSAGKVKAARWCRIPALSVNEPGLNMVAGNGHQFADYRGATWGGPVWAPGAASDANGPTLVNAAGSGTEYLNWNGAQWMASALDAAYDLSGAVGVTIINFFRPAGNGGVGGIFRDITATTAPYLCNKCIAGTHQLEVKPSTVVTNVDTGIATGTTWQVAFVYKQPELNGVDGLNGITSGDALYSVALGGRMAARSPNYVQRPPTSGSNMEGFGRQAANFFTGDSLGQIAYFGDLSQSQVAAVHAFAMLKGMTVDVTHDVFIGVGASFADADNNLGAPLTDAPSTTAINTAGGTGTLASLGFESTRAATAWGTGGQATHHITTIFNRTVGIWSNPRRRRRNVIFLWDVFYNMMKAGTETAGEIDAIACMAEIKARGWYTLLGTIIDGAYMYSGTPAAATGLTTQGTRAKAFNDIICANWRTYPNCIGVVDMRADPHLAIDVNNNGGNGVQCGADVAYYEGGQALHLVNAGYQYIGATPLKNWLKDNMGALDGVGALSIYTAGDDMISHLSR